MKLQSQFVFFICLLIAIYFHKQTFSETRVKEKNYNSYTLKLERGAQLNDRFAIEVGSMLHIPDLNNSHKKQNSESSYHFTLDSTQVSELFNEIENKGFWHLEERYGAESSSRNIVKITFEGDGRSKTITCDDFEENCPELIGYIHQKVVELERERPNKSL